MIEAPGGAKIDALNDPSAAACVMARCPVSSVCNMSQAFGDTAPALPVTATMWSAAGVPILMRDAFGGASGSKGHVSRAEAPGEIAIAPRIAIVIENPRCSMSSSGDYAVPTLLSSATNLGSFRSGSNDGSTFSQTIDSERSA